MNKQEIFDTVVQGAMEQGIPALEDGKYCMYRGDNGTKCFVGMLIPDDLYDKNMEETTAEKLCESFPDIADVILPKDMHKYSGEEFLSSLQIIHDNVVLDLPQPLSKEVVQKYWMKKLKTFAQENDLNDKVLQAY